MFDSSFEQAGAVVTGGAGGIGAAIVEALIDRGVRVASLDRRPGANGAISFECDVTDPGSVDRAVAEAAERLPRLRWLVCAAGVVSEHPLAEMTDEAWHRVVDVSLSGTFHAVRAVAPRMEGGAIVAFSSGYATMGYARGGHYAAAKAGVEALVKSLARELAPQVRVNAIAPGPVQTPMLHHIEDPDAWRKSREAAIPLGRIGEPVDVVGPTLFLLGPSSGYVTGQILHVNGGLLMP